MSNFNRKQLIREQLNSKQNFILVQQLKQVFITPSSRWITPETPFTICELGSIRIQNSFTFSSCPFCCFHPRFWGFCVTYNMPAEIRRKHDRKKLKGKWKQVKSGPNNYFMGTCLAMLSLSIGLTSRRRPSARSTWRETRYLVTHLPLSHLHFPEWWNGKHRFRCNYSRERDSPFPIGFIFIFNQASKIFNALSSHAKWRQRRDEMIVQEEEIRRRITMSCLPCGKPNHSPPQPIQTSFPSKLVRHKTPT